MLVTILKALGLAAFVALLSEITKRSTLLAAVMVALPLMTILNVAFTATKENGVAIANQFSNSTFLLFWPGLAFFIVLWAGQKFGLSFWVSFALAVVVTGAATWGFTVMYKAMGLKL